VHLAIIGLADSGLQDTSRGSANRDRASAAGARGVDRLGDLR